MVFRTARMRGQHADRRSTDQATDQVTDPLVGQAAYLSHLAAQKGFMRLPDKVRAPDPSFAGLPVKLPE